MDRVRRAVPGCKRNSVPVVPEEKHATALIVSLNVRGILVSDSFYRSAPRVIEGPNGRGRYAYRAQRRNRMARVTNAESEAERIPRDDGSHLDAETSAIILNLSSVIYVRDL